MFRWLSSHLRSALAAPTEIPAARAVRELEASLAARPADAEKRSQLVRALFELAGHEAARGELEKALDAYRRLLAHKPDEAAALCNQATTLKLLGRPREAIECYRRALELAPGFADAGYNLGVAHRDCGDSAEAVGAFRRAVDLNPRLIDAHVGLGHALRDLDRTDEALAAFRHALAVDPDAAAARWSIAMAQLPLVYGYGDDPGVFRQRFARELAELEHWLGDHGRGQAASTVGIDQPFELPYQEENNRDLLARYGRLCARLMDEWRVSENLPTPAVRRRRPLRVGVVSAHLRFHSVWSAITRGWFEALDRERYTIRAFYLGTHVDAETAFAHDRAGHFERGPKDLRQWAQAIQAQEPDVLIYPEIGMDPMTVRLASLRLAPVQAATWGHPETTGLPTIDYYLSGEDLEPPHAQRNYTEELVALPHLGCHFRAPDLAPAAIDPAAAGVDESVPILLCPGVPIKYAPQFDWVLPQIARRLGRCQFVFFRQSNGVLSERLSGRLAAVFRAHGLDVQTFVRFVPWQSPAGFLGWLRRSTVYLDTIGFSGFNTALYAIHCGLPIVTREGRFLRGRLASAILKRIGLPELVVPTEAAYVDAAVDLARDAAHRAAIGARIERGRGRLYQDEHAMRGLESFLSRVTS